MLAITRRQCERILCNYGEQENGKVTHFWTLDQPLARLFPILVSLIPIQNTNAAKTTTKVYSTRPCPSSSSRSRFSKFISSPPVEICLCDYESNRRRICSAIFLSRPFLGRANRTAK